MSSAIWKSGKLLRYCLAGLVLIMLPFLFFLFMHHRDKNLLLKEFDRNLDNLIHSIDYSIANELEEVQCETRNIINLKEFSELEFDYLNTGDAGRLQKELQRIVSVHEQMLSCAIAYCDDQFLVCSQTGTDCDYELYDNTEASGVDIIVCKEDNDIYYLGTRVISDNPRFTYYLLFSSEQLYELTIAKSLWDDCWIALYDMQSGLLIQNHDNQPIYRILSEQEISDEKNGINFLYNTEKKGESGTLDYRFPNIDGIEKMHRILAIPSSLTSNRRFAIGIARQSEIIYNSSRMQTYYLIASTSALLIGLVLVLIGFGCTQKAIRIQNEEAETLKLQTQLQDAQLHNTMAQLQPHFLYNALASIREIVLDDPEYGSDLIYNFTTHLRACLRAASSNSLISFAQEMDNVRAYVEIEKMRFDDRFIYVEDLQRTGFDIVPLTIQPLVENAIRHGIVAVRGFQGHITVRSFEEADYFCVTVEDDGQGFDYNKWQEEVLYGDKDSIGLKNSMLGLQNRQHAEVNVDTVIGEGTRITIRIPKER